MNTLPKLDRTRASDSVFEVLRDSILTRVFRPGDRLDVKAVATQLGVSPTPVKDAINRLAAEGLIDVRPRSGTYVAEISPQAVAETFEIRRALECLAAEALIERLNAQLIARFSLVFDVLERPVDSEEARREHDQKNIEFHLLIVEGSGNQRLLELYHSLNAHLTIARIHLRRRPDAARLDQELREHRAIMDAITAKDTKRLVDALGQHIKRAGQALVDDVTRAQAGDD
jgi:GntR family transcriptional regulator, rspAB operon transcriptional repressor